ncbi:MAG TPA: hypothetical protein VEF33_10165 [Syntrophales bacterium]|nr:hypothetical protein [Syntrophales bacterium]
MKVLKMKKKDKDDTIEDYKKIDDEVIFDKVNEIFRSRPDDYIDALERIGFEYHEEDDDGEEIEERNAKPKNKNQRILVTYFEGEDDPSDKIFETFLTERYAKRPNLPLIRKYFKKANQKLKALLIYGLDHYPGRIDLLSDLTYFHNFENILPILVVYYTRACVNQANLETFSVLAQDFYYATNPDGYEALHALRELFEPHTEKRKIIDFLISEEEEVEDKKLLQ